MNLNNITVFQEKEKAMFRKISLVAVLFIGGCAAMFNSKVDKVEFRSTPEGATVVLDGVPIGKTPLVANVNVREQEHKVMFALEGYLTRGAMISSGIGGGWVVLDILCGLIPVIIDAATESWYELDTTKVDITLQPIPDELK